MKLEFVLLRGVRNFRIKYLERWIDNGNKKKRIHNSLNNLLNKNVQRLCKKDTVRRSHRWENTQDDTIKLAISKLYASSRYNEQQITTTSCTNKLTSVEIRISINSLTLPFFPSSPSRKKIPILEIANWPANKRYTPPRVVHTRESISRSDKYLTNSIRISGKVKLGEKIGGGLTQLRGWLYFRVVYFVIALIAPKSWLYTPRATENKW